MLGYENSADERSPLKKLSPDSGQQVKKVGTRPVGPVHVPMISESAIEHCLSSGPRIYNRLSR